MQEPQETWVRFLGLEDPLEEEMATHSSILAGIILWTEEAGGLQSIQLQRVGQDWAHTHTQWKTIKRIFFNSNVEPELNQKFIFIGV